MKQDAKPKATKPKAAATPKTAKPKTATTSKTKKSFVNDFVEQHATPPTLEANKAEAVEHQAQEAEQWAQEAEEAAVTPQTPAEALAGVKTYREFLQWCIKHPTASLYRKSCGNAVVGFQQYKKIVNERDIIELELANGASSYPFCAVIHRYFNIL
jgi:hypothetical protein